MGKAIKMQEKPHQNKERKNLQKAINIIKQIKCYCLVKQQAN